MAGRRVFEARLEGLIAEAAKRGQVNLSLVRMDSTTARAHHDAPGTHLDEDVIAALERAAAEEEEASSKGVVAKNEAGRTAKTIPHGREERRRIRRPQTDRPAATEPLPCPCRHKCTWS